MSESAVTVRYLANSKEAFEAALSAVQACGYRVVNQDEDNGIIRLVRSYTYRVGGGSLITSLIRFSTISESDFAAEVQISETSKEEIDITTVPGNRVDVGEHQEIASQLFHRLDKLLGEGKLIQGKLGKPGVLNELKKMLIVLAIFGFGVVILILLAFWKR